MDPGRRRLEVAFALVQGGAVAEAQDSTGPAAIAPERLVDGMGDIRFRYRGLDASQRPGEWQSTWDVPEALPLQVEIRIRDADGRDWPTLVVALPLAGSYAVPVAAR